MVLYPSLKAGALHGISIFNVVLMMFSSTLAIIIVVRYSNFGLMNTQVEDIGTLDYVFAGIWAGFFYGTAGIVGMCCSYERKRSLLIATVALAILSLVGAVTAGCISGIVGFHILKNKEIACTPKLNFTFYLQPYNESSVDCLVWQDLEFSLMGFSVLGGIVNLTCLIITLIGLCGLEKSNGLVRMDTLRRSISSYRRPSA